MPSTIESGERRDLEMQQGMTFRRVPFVTWSTGAPPVPVDLSVGFTADMDVKTAYGDTGEVLFSLSHSDGITLNTLGKIDLEIDEERAAMLVLRDEPYVYDLRLKHISSTDVIYLVFGSITIQPWVTPRPA